MNGEKQTSSKCPAPSTKDLVTVKRPEKNKAPITPWNLFLGGGESNKGERPSKSNPMCDTRTKVLTPLGKQVLTSDARLHLEKIKQQNKAPEKQVVDVDKISMDDELRRLISNEKY